MSSRLRTISDNLSHTVQKAGLNQKEHLIDCKLNQLTKLTVKVTTSTQFAIQTTNGIEIHDLTT